MLRHLFLSLSVWTPLLFIVFFSLSRHKPRCPESHSILTPCTASLGFWNSPKSFLGNVLVLAPGNQVTVLSPGDQGAAFHAYHRFGQMFRSSSLQTRVQFGSHRSSADPLDLRGQGNVFPCASCDEGPCQCSSFLWDLARHTPHRTLLQGMWSFILHSGFPTQAAGCLQV